MDPPEIVSYAKFKLVAAILSFKKRPTLHFQLTVPVAKYEPDVYDGLARMTNGNSDMKEGYYSYDLELKQQEELEYFLEDYGVVYYDETKDLKLDTHDGGEFVLIQGKIKSKKVSGALFSHHPRFIRRYLSYSNTGALIVPRQIGLILEQELIRLGVEYTPTRRFKQLRDHFGKVPTQEEPPSRNKVLLERDSSEEELPSSRRGRITVSFEEGELDQLIANMKMILTKLEGVRLEQS